MGNTGSKENIKEALKELSDRGKIKTMEDEFWTTYWQTNIMSLKELLGLVSLDEIRKIKAQNRSNFITFCLHCMNQIFKLCKASVWSDTDGIAGMTRVISISQQQHKMASQAFPRHNGGTRFDWFLLGCKK
ncbi:hypothetical protein MXB_4730 [Myxobolus squamalis]|nr:hypothetical protein MXB_4730 [Myxobolus squamalis]